MTTMVAALGHGRVQHQCCWYVAADTPCGLWCGHDGDHIPYVPGVYLPPPAIDPLTLGTLRQHGWYGLVCPLCGARTQGLSCEGPYCVYRDGDGNAFWYEPGDRPGSIEIAWRFEPCGCEGRELLR